MNQTEYALYFDAAFTLIKPEKSIGEHYADVAKKFGYQPDAQALNQNFNPAFQDARKHRDPVMVGNEVDTRAFWRQVVSDIFKRSDEKHPPDPFFDELFDAFATKEFWGVYDDTFPAIERAKEFGIQVGLLSNFDSRLDPLLVDLNLKDQFQSIIVSADVQVEKPDSKIFEIAEGKLTATNYAIIGDSFDDDIEGGKAVGWKAIHVMRDQEVDLIEKTDHVSVSNLMSGIEWLAKSWKLSSQKVGNAAHD